MPSIQDPAACLVHAHRQLRHVGIATPHPVDPFMDPEDFNETWDAFVHLARAFAGAGNIQEMDPAVAAAIRTLAAQPANIAEENA